MEEENINLLSIEDCKNEDILFFIQQADKIQKSPQQFSEIARGKILALLFFEPSTRTYFSFASAMQRLGGNFLGFRDAAGTSIVKGESLEDTARMMASYADLLAIRHAEEGSLKRITAVVNVPVINAGEGAAEHPTQTLADLYTIYKRFQRFDLTIALYGDLKFGRTNHSLLLAGARLGANFICIAPKELQMPNSYLQLAEKAGAKIILTDNIKTYYPDIDVLYVSRLQKERLPQNLEYQQLKEQFLVDQSTLDQLKSTALIMHPLPRISEIDAVVDTDPRAKYFEQAANAVYMRMAILMHLLQHKVV